MGQHVFVAMPYGVKEGIDFNAVYAQFIVPALRSLDFTVFRADEEMRAGDIRGDMFQELLLADVVVVDLTIDNPNVWYELGVRHALRARGVILISAREGRMPFDLVTDRNLRYRLLDRVPDPAFLDADRAALAQMAHETVTAWYARIVSPIYRLLPYLREPDWKTLRVGVAQEFWSKQDAWARRVSVARRKQRPGDILVLAEEAPIQGLRLEAYRLAAKALRELEQFDFALAQIDQALEVAPDDLISRQEKGILLGRLRRFDEAKEWLISVADDHTRDAETRGLLGRVEKDNWINAWRTASAGLEQNRVAAATQIGMLRESIAAYTEGFLRDATNYYCGINAVTLRHLERHLVGGESSENEAYRAEMEGGVRWAARAALSKESIEKKDFWARVTLADLAVLVSDGPSIGRAYQYAVAASERNWFALDATRQQLSLLFELGFRPAEVELALGAVKLALSQLEPPFHPGKVFLFSGHMLDEPGRTVERFPDDMEDLVRCAIEQRLDKFGATEGDLALCQGACGGDLLFAQAALHRKLRLELRLPFDEPTFIKQSVSFAGQKWRDRYLDVKSHAATQIFKMPDDLGPAPASRNPYVRTNLWQLYTARAWGAERVRMIALWDGEKSGKPGGTDHMVDEVEKFFGQIEIIDSRDLLSRTHARRSQAGDDHAG
ncbi:tetratricopeptide repeat-containing protein [Paraburkholderia sp. SIMBA_054]|uniref:tetratricopeptide repeat-containing protein n=1 Tax=Paraburkholderia sp. SIMBA_054 TaxID=3085795 RepID=UPI003978976E